MEQGSAGDVMPVSKPGGKRDDRVLNHIRKVLQRLAAHIAETRRRS